MDGPYEYYLIDEKEMKDIQFIQVQEDYAARSWLGIIVGANLYVDFSIPGQPFEDSYALLVSQIKALGIKPANKKVTTL